MRPTSYPPQEPQKNLALQLLPTMLVECNQRFAYAFLIAKRLRIWVEGLSGLSDFGKRSPKKKQRRK